MDEIKYRDEGIILFQAEKKAKDLNCVKYLECSALSKSGFVILSIIFENIKKTVLGLKGVFDEAIRVALGIYNKPSKPETSRSCKFL